MSIRTYVSRTSVVFCKTNQRWGEFSSMASVVPMVVGNTRCRTREYFYQAMRHTGHPQIQQQVLDTPSPIAAKQLARTLAPSRIDWHDVNVAIMRYAIWVQTWQHRALFETLFEAAENKPIVEWSKKDPFWGASPQDPGVLAGCNVLGRLWMERRDWVRERGFSPAKPPTHTPDFKLLGYFMV